MGPRGGRGDAKHLRVGFREGLNGNRLRHWGDRDGGVAIGTRLGFRDAPVRTAGDRLPPEWLVELDQSEGGDGVSLAFYELDELLEARTGVPVIRRN